MYHLSKKELVHIPQSMSLSSNLCRCHQICGIVVELVSWLLNPCYGQIHIVQLSSLNPWHCRQTGVLPGHHHLHWGCEWVVHVADWLCMSLLEGICCGWAVCIVVRWYASSLEGTHLWSVAHVVDGGGYQPCCDPAIDLIKHLSLLWNQIDPMKSALWFCGIHMWLSWTCGCSVGRLTLAHIPWQGEGLVWVWGIGVLAFMAVLGWR